MSSKAEGAINLPRLRFVEVSSSIFEPEAADQMLWDTHYAQSTFQAMGCIPMHGSATASGLINSKGRCQVGFTHGIKWVFLGIVVLAGVDSRSQFHDFFSYAR